MSACSGPTDDEPYAPPTSESDGSDSDVPVNHHVHGEIREEIDTEAEPQQRWDGTLDSIRIGTTFKTKEDVQRAVTLWSARRSVTYRLLESRPHTWVVECITRDPSFPQERLHGAYCNWSMRASKKVLSNKWKIVKWVDEHRCGGANAENVDRNVTSREIAALIFPKVRDDPSYKVAFIRTDVHTEYGVRVSYKKAWHGRRKANDAVYGSWETNFRDLPRYLSTVRQLNPGTVVQWKFPPGYAHSSRRPFKYVFWAFGPSIQAYKECRPVLSVDGTFLRGAYKGKLLMAVAKTANNNILPIA